MAFDDKVFTPAAHLESLGQDIKKYVLPGLNKVLFFKFYLLLYLCVNLQ